MADAPILIDLPSEILGERVRLRPYQAGDGAEMFTAIDESRDHLRPWLPWVDAHQTSTDSEALARRFDARWRLREDLVTGVWDRETGRYLGGSGLHRIDWELRRFEVGYWLRRDAEGKGYMTEAASLLCDLAFDSLEANRVFIRCASTNLRSAAIPKRLGFAHEGTLRNDGVDPDGNLYDMLVFGMTPERWRERTAARSSAGVSQSGVAPASASSPSAP